MVAALAQLGVRKATGRHDRAEHAQHLEQYYAVPQLGAVIVPLNYRLAARIFVYLANHSGARACACTRTISTSSIRTRPHADRRAFRGL
jgi:acyl-CoA synthetase (AMP-forming)/AMP-acid ligase II